MNKKCKAQEIKLNIPSYECAEGEEIPIYFEKRPYQGASGRVYPIPFVSTLTSRKKDKEYDAIVLENEYVKVVALPEFGGKIQSAEDKTNGYDFIYNNKVIKPAMVGLAGPWLSGGIEFNWPQHHRPTTFMPVPYAICSDKDGDTVWIGEIDYFHNMKGMLGISLEEHSSCLKVKVRVYNSSPSPHPFMWWANTAVEINDSYKIVFPPDVEYVNDHDRRAVLKWPIAEGIYATARPYNYGKGTDIHWCKNIMVPSSFMVSKGQSNFDFVSGYDESKQAGMVTVADHHIAPGKKLWTWGNGKFGDKWCANLTDDGSRYVEIMTGCYTDNQPDFTWIAPYETKEFEQFWFPVKDIGEVKNANSWAACNLERQGDDLFIGFYCTTVRKGCSVKLYSGNELVFEDIADISPENTYVKNLPFTGDYNSLHLSLMHENREIIGYSPVVRGKKKPIKPRLPAKRPQEIESIEELYLNGLHLVQYKHFAYRAENYFMEALRRDPTDMRCNKAMGDYWFERADFKKAVSYYDRAIEKACLRNCNPEDTEAYYMRGMCYAYLGNDAAAYADFYECIWAYVCRARGYYGLAMIESRRKNYAAAVEKLNDSLQSDGNNLWALHIKGILLGKLGCNREAQECEEQLRKADILFIPDFCDTRYALHFAAEYIRFALYEEAETVLLKAKDNALKFYYLAYLENKLGGDAKQYLAKAENENTAYNFPSRPDDAAVLQWAGTPRSAYYLGCLLYGFERYDEAAIAWEKAVAAEELGPAYRNLALAYFDHLGQAEKAVQCMEKAFALMPENARVFYELTQLYRAMNYPLEKQLALYKENSALVKARDDCTLNYSILLTLEGKLQDAKDVLLGHEFHTYEGGEGNLTRHHAWLQYLIGKSLFEQGDYRGAAEQLCAGLVFPECYGEEKTYFVNDAQLYYLLALCCGKQGDDEGKEKYLLLADSTKDDVSIHTYFQCLACNVRGDTARTQELAKRMEKVGKTKIKNCEIDAYYGVGAKTYPPFGYNIRNDNLLEGYVLLSFAALAQGNRKQAERFAKKAERIDCCNFGINLLRKLLYD